MKLTFKLLNIFQVRAKMEQKEYIILCLEDSNDWSNATTRRVVMQVRL